MTEGLADLCMCATYLMLVSLGCLSGDLGFVANCVAANRETGERKREQGGGGDIGELNQTGGRIMEKKPDKTE